LAVVWASVLWSNLAFNLGGIVVEDKLTCETCDGDLFHVKVDDEGMIIGLECATDGTYIDME
jgi:uncharacterized protein YuzE